jgi:D-beta-D-heptose 7-phosphate kinase / D-beta-D-heptose 1-phosphate adenosyltransferase
MNRLVVIGDALLDRDIDGAVDRIAPDAPVPVVDQECEQARPGGAGLAALLAARDGFATSLITAVGDDEAGRTLVGLLAEEGVEVLDLGISTPTPEKVRIRTDGRPLVRLDRGGNGLGEVGAFSDEARDAVAAAAGILVSDYGRGVAATVDVTDSLLSSASQKPVVWDPHPRGSTPPPGIQMVTPNISEAALFSGEECGDGLKATQDVARSLMRRWSVSGMAVTMGSRGALFVDGGAHPLMVPAPHVHASDPCGAGDRFAVTVTTGLTDGLLPSEAVTRAVMDSARFVATGGAGAIQAGEPYIGPRVRPFSEAAALAEQMRASGGTVVATGGCFDIIHPGHVAFLESARSLGDCLIVCLNSDQSVRELKGPGRPVNECADRIAVLNGLSSVDAVEVFHSTMPHDALRRIEPHIWVKGGDYGSTALPEASLVESWGGEVVILPYMRGHSTTGILNRARR